MTGKGKKTMAEFMKRYGAKKGKGVFYGKAANEGKGSKFYELAHGK
jgi:hypothetical protein